MKTSMSRFQIHDDLTAPEGSVTVLRGALASGGQLPNFLGVLAGSPAALRAYARFRAARVRGWPGRRRRRPLRPPGPRVFGAGGERGAGVVRSRPPPPRPPPPPP